jgi:hypothetical protein
MSHIEYHEGPNRRVDLIQAGSVSVETTTKGVWINTDAGAVFIPDDDEAAVADALDGFLGLRVYRVLTGAIEIAPKVA